MNKKSLRLASLLALLVFVSCSKSETENTDTKDTSRSTREITFGTMTDQDGNTCKTVTIGTQTWMAENLKVAHYNDGTGITNAQTTRAWGNSYTGDYCSFNNNSSNSNTYGLLYNWYAVNTCKLAPKGWHVPSDSEWTVLFNYLTTNSFGYTSGKNDIAKSLASTSGWTTSTKSGAVGNSQSDNNKSGFNALAGGERYCEGGFRATLGSEGYWWSSSSSSSDNSGHYFGITYNAGSVENGNIDKREGFSVRCVKDE
jgi:uncharacterized protein (TIGR02145 family)